MSRVGVDVWVYGCVRCLSRVCVCVCLFVYVCVCVCARALKMSQLAAGQTTIHAVQYWCCIVGDGRSHLSKCAVRIMLQIGGKNWWHSNVLFFGTSILTVDKALGVLANDFLEKGQPGGVTGVEREEITTSTQPSRPHTMSLERSIFTESEQGSGPQQPG